MNQQITILEALSQEDTIRFWEALHQYHIRDVFPDPAQKEELQWQYNIVKYRNCSEVVLTFMQG